MAKEGRVGLGLWDRLVLFTAWVVTCGLVYVLGFYVGKGTQEQRLGLEERLVRLPVTSKPPPEGQRPRSESGLTFYDKLGSGEHADDKAAAGGPPEPAADSSPPAPAASPPAPRPIPTESTMRPTAAAAPPAARAAAPAESPTAARPTAAPPPAVAVARPAVAPVAPAPVAARPAATPPAPAPAVRDVAPARPEAPPAEVAAVRPPPLPGHGWTVQANPTRSRDEADALYRQLRAGGYEAVIVRILRDGETWYRVQVGRFPSAQLAGETMRKLKEREGVQHVFVASE